MTPDYACEIDHRRVLAARQRHHAVIDVGSNSIRLVVYDDLSRAPFQRFNEKSLCALGAELSETGRMSAESIERALHAIGRFVAIARAMDVEQIDVIATEAARRAENGAELVERIRHLTGLEATVLSGDEEATHSAMGVVSGLFRPSGIVGDMGGGSLDVAEVLGDRVGERTASMGLGALPVLAHMKQGLDEAKRFVDATLREQLPPLLTEPVLYAVGGGWRALARVHIAANESPISVVHGYELDARELRALAKRISRMTVEQVSELPDVPSRRIATLPAAALVMARLLRTLRPERVVFSALGLREGWLYAQLSAEEQARDPLIEGALAIALPRARVPAFSAALERWTHGLFPGESAADRRLRIAACALSDVLWRDHSKVRALESFHRLLQYPFTGVTHADRAFLAVTIMARYGGKVNPFIERKVGQLLNASQLRRAEILGRVLLVAHRFSGSVPEILEQARLHIDADAVRLVVLNPDCVPDSDAVHTRLRQLARVTGVDGAEVVLTPGESSEAVPTAKRPAS